MRVRDACAPFLILACPMFSRGDAPEPNRPATAKVEKGPIRVVATLKGIVESDRMDEVAIGQEASTLPMTVERAVDHGSAVKKGEVLVVLDRDKIDHAIDDLRVEIDQSRAALRHAERELPVLEKLMPLDLATAERSKARSAEDLARFLETDRPLALLGVEFADKSAQFSVESSEDELAQLEKMYRSKDLTEETEQMILKRHRFQVEMARFMLKMARNQNDQTLKVELPRRELAAREEADRQSLALEKSRGLLPLEIGQKRLALHKLAFELAKNEEKLVRLGRDRDAMVVRSPADGVVFHGKATRGQWTTAAAVGPRLAKGGVLTPDEVIVTIVASRPAFIRATVEEKDLHWLRPGAEGKAVPAGFPDLKLPARLASVSSVPQTAGVFEARVEVELAPAASAVMPGMACTARFLAYRKDDALTVPESAVSSDDEEEHHVFLPGPGGARSRRVVAVGRISGGRAEILDGLKEGDEILTSKP